MPKKPRVYSNRYGLGPCRYRITDHWGTYIRWCPEEGKDPKPPKTLAGKCNASSIWVRSYSDIPVLAHEITHSVDFWMAEIGISNDTEVRAYAVQDALKYILSRLKAKRRR